MIVVTSGSAYLDIDAYAGCIAFAQLLNLQGLEAKAISSAPLNQSISQTLRDWQDTGAISRRAKALADHFQGTAGVESGGGLGAHGRPPLPNSSTWMCGASGIGPVRQARSW